MPAFSHFWIRRMLHEADEPVLAQLVEERSDIGVQYVVHLPAFDPNTKCVKRIVRAAPRPESVTEPEEVFLVDRIQQCSRRPLDDLVLQSSNR
jgi:hypothetical protein